MDDKPNKIFKDRDNIPSILEPHIPKENLKYVTREGGRGKDGLGYLFPVEAFPPNLLASL